MNTVDEKKIDLAEEKTLAKFPKAYVLQSNGDYIFSEEAQDYFNSII